MGMENILNLPEGSPATILSVQLYQPWKHHGTEKSDVLSIVYKDENDNKKVRFIKDPPMEIFFVKPEHRSFTTQREYIEKEKTYSKMVPARNVLYAIADEMRGCSDPQSLLYRSIYSQAMDSGNRYARKEIFKWPYTLFSDMSVEEYYRVMLGYHYNLDRNHIVDKAYLDIESDVFGLSTSQTNANMDPTNACTIVFNFDQNRKVKIKPKVFTFALRNHKRYKDQKFVEDHLDEFIEACHKEFDHQTVTKNGKKKVVDFEADYYIKFYDDEGEMLCAIFDVINKIRPDVLSVWNIAYDIPKMAARMQANGLNYVDVMCDPKFPESIRFVEMNIDRRPKIEIGDRKTYIRMASTTIYNDQMQSYAGMRKGRKAFGSNNLDNISNIELGMGKRRFRKGVNVFNAAIEDYWNFLLYNITDVIRQVLIDMMTNDTFAMMIDMNQHQCTWENLFKQTRYQKMIYYTSRLRKGFISGNNPNIDYIRGESEESLERLEELRRAREYRWQIDEEDADIDPGSEYEDEVDEVTADEDEEFDETAEDAAMQIAGELLTIYNDSINRHLPLPGGLVGDPDFNSPIGTELIKGMRSKHVFDNVMDMDFASEYPWAKYTRSMSKSTQIGRVVIAEKISDRQNTLPLGQSKRVEEIKVYLPGAEFTEDLVSHDVLSFGNVWFNLPSVMEMQAGLRKHIKNKEETKDGSHASRLDGAGSKADAGDGFYVLIPRLNRTQAR